MRFPRDLHRIGVITMQSRCNLHAISNSYLARLPDDDAEELVLQPLLLDVEIDKRRLGRHLST